MALPTTRGEQGFTLLELLIVLSILATLLTLSMPRYFGAMDRSNEQVLAFNLRTARNAIDQFFSDRGRLPASLEELVEQKYLKELPIDPVTGRNDSWALVTGNDPRSKGISDIKSGAEGTAPSGKAYADL